MPDGHHGGVCGFDSMTVITDFYALQTIVLLQLKNTIHIVDYVLIQYVLLNFRQFLFLLFYHVLL